MTPKEYLNQYRESVRRYYAARDHLDELHSIAEHITPVYCSSGGGGGTRDGDEKMINAVSKIIDAKNRVSDELEMLEATEREVTRTIDAVKDRTLRTLLYERYINGKTWEQIAVTMNYSYQHIVHFLHPRSLEAVKHLIESNITPVL